jgi:hypothetical protein
LARYLAANFPADSFYVSLGLWGRDGKVMDPRSLGAGLASTLKGGARRVWITPDSLVTEEHWNAVLPYLMAGGREQDFGKTPQLRPSP